MQKLQHEIVKLPPRDIKVVNILGRDFELEDLSTSDLRRIVAGEMNNDIYGLRTIATALGGHEPCIIDIGANIGMFFFACDVVFGDFRYHGIEPHPVNFASLQANLARNKPNMVKAVKQAALVPHGTHELPSFTIGFDNTGGATSCLGAMPAEVVRPPKMVDLEMLLDFKYESPLIVKMDIEGAEHEVLAKLPKSWRPRIDYFIGELHMNKHLAAQGYTYEKTLAIARKLAKNVHFTNCAMAE